MLNGPLLDADPLTLLHVWRQEEVRITCTRPPELEDHPDLPVRIRGALGRVMKDLPGPISYRHDPFKRPAPFPYLFGSAATARPFAIDCDVVGREVVVSARLFGAARIWADQLRDCLLAVLDQGVSIRSESRIRYPMQPTDCMMRTAVPPLPPDVIRSATLRFITPVAVRDGTRLSSSSGAFLWASVTRIRDLAPWHGVKLEADWLALRRAIDDVRVSDSQMTPVRFRRWSQRQRDNVIPMMGFIGATQLRGPLTPFGSFLTLAEATHVGSHAALGFGRMTAALYSL